MEECEILYHKCALHKVKSTKVKPILRQQGVSFLRKCIRVEELCAGWMDGDGTSITFQIININSNLIHYEFAARETIGGVSNLKSQISCWPHHHLVHVARLSPNILFPMHTHTHTPSVLQWFVFSFASSSTHIFAEDLLMLSVYILLEDFIYDKPHKTQMS